MFRSNIFVSCVLSTCLLAAACNGDEDRASAPPDAGALDAASGARPDVDAQGGRRGLDVPECLADLSVDPDELRELVSDLSGVNEVTVGGERVRIDDRSSERGRVLARTYLRERYLDLGYEVAEHAYDGGFGAGANLVAQRAGDDGEFFIVSAHLDSVRGSPGADDDASGIATGFAIAHALKDCALAHSLRLVAFDQEEVGILGSYTYASEIARGSTRMLGMVHLEMTGYDSDRSGDYMLVHCDKPKDVAIASAMIAAVDTLGLPLRHNHFCTDASDHWQFWAYGLPAIAMGEHFFSTDPQSPADPNPCYHDACDTADALDYEYMADLTTATALAVGALVGAR